MDINWTLIMILAMCLLFLMWLYNRFCNLQKLETEYKRWIYESEYDHKRFTDDMRFKQEKWMIEQGENGFFQRHWQHGTINLDKQ